MSHPDPLEEIRAEANKGNLSSAAEKCLAFLRQNPKNLDAVTLYGELAIGLGLHANAIVVFQKLLALSPNNSHAHDRLAFLYNRQDDYTNATAHARAALRLNPRLVGPHVVFGAILLQQKKGSEAIREFDMARKLDPGSLRVELDYANALLVSGEFERASETLRELIAQHPLEARPYLMLARSRKFKEGDPDVALIRSIMDQQGELRAAFRGKENKSVTAYMTLFKLESDLGNLDKGFRCLKAAKDIAKILTPYDYPKRKEQLANTREVFNTDFLTMQAPTACMARDPIFVVGMPRSGTTLLERILSSHQDIVAAGELPHVSRIIQELCAKLGSNQYDLPALHRVPEESWREIGEEYIRRARQQHAQGKHFIDKMPGNFLYLGFIRKMLPEAKIVHISRHPMANCLSLYEQDFRAIHPYSNDLRWTGLEYLEYRQMMDHWRSQFGDKIIEIKYEDLVSRPAQTIHWLGEQLGLELYEDETAMTQSQSQGTIRTASVWQARQPIHTGSMARWEQLQDHLQPLLETLAPELKPTD